MPAKPKPKSKPAPPKGKGRPPYDTGKLPDGWAEMVLDLYEEGAHDVEIYAKVLHMSRNTFVKLMETDPHFLTTIQRGRELAEAYYMKQARRGLWLAQDGPRFNHQTFALTMRNRFGWDAKTPEQSADNTIRIEVAVAQPPANTEDISTSTNNNQQYGQ